MPTSVVARFPEVALPDVGARTTQKQLEQLFRDHHDFVWRVAAGLGVPPHALDDVVQDVFIIVGRKLQNYAERGAVRGWLVAITRRVIADLRKREARRDARDERADPPSTPKGPEGELLRSDGARLVQRFLEGLPEAQREVFVLMEVEELSAPEVAAAVGEKLNTVYSRLRLARGRFDAYCRALDEDEPEASCPTT